MQKDESKYRDRHINSYDCCSSGSKSKQFMSTGLFLKWKKGPGEF